VSCVATTCLFWKKIADITMSGRHVGDMSATFPAKTINLDYNKSKVVMMVMVEVMGMILSLGIFGGGKKNRGC
jgi:hypothetical protein